MIQLSLSTILSSGEITENDMIIGTESVTEITVIVPFLSFAGRYEGNGSISSELNKKG